MTKTEVGDAKTQNRTQGSKCRRVSSPKRHLAPAAEASWPQTDSIFAPRSQTFGAKTSLSAECRPF